MTITRFTQVCSIVPATIACIDLCQRALENGLFLRAGVLLINIVALANQNCLSSNVTGACSTVAVTGPISAQGKAVDSDRYRAVESGC